MQFFGARANLAKSLLYAINGGVDELKGTLVVPGIEKNTEEVLEYSRVITDYKKVLSRALCGRHQYHPLYARQVRL